MKTEETRHESFDLVNLAVVAVSPEMPLAAFTDRLSKELSAHTSTLHLTSRQVCEIFGLRGIEPFKEENPFTVRLSAWFNEQEARYDVMVYEADLAASAWTKRCLQNADKILVLVPGHKPASTVQKELISLFQNECRESSNRALVFVHPEGTSNPTNSDHWLSVLPANEHYHVLQGRNSDIQRIARFLVGKAINLVLSGGAACGIAHIGVIRAFEECDVPIDSISGTSMGAVIASQYAMGLAPSDLLKINRWVWVLSKPMNDMTLPLISFLRGRKLDLAGKKIFKDTKIEDLWIPFFCVSANLTSAEIVIHRKGALFNAIRATTSVPGLVPPVVRDNEILVDGGVLNNLPVDIARRFFKGKFVAVDVSDAKALNFPRSEFPSPWKVLWSLISQASNRDYVPSILDIIYRSALVGSRQQTERAKQEADFILRLPLERFKFLEFESFDKIVDVGYRNAKMKIQEWKDTL